jgi:hypothetical protein
MPDYLLFGRAAYLIAPAPWLLRHNFIPCARPIRYAAGALRRVTIFANLALTTRFQQVGME